MELRVVREYYAPDCTIGRMLIDGQFECYTLEDGIRTNKVAGETAIPAGRYPVKITYSNAFRRELPLVEGVRNFTGIRIHSGNSKKDTLGCILVGQSWTPGADVIGASVRAMQALLPKIRAALGAGEAVTLSVEQPNAPPELASRELQPVAPRRRKKAAQDGQAREPAFEAIDKNESCPHAGKESQARQRRRLARKRVHQIQPSKEGRCRPRVRSRPRSKPRQPSAGRRRRAPGPPGPRGHGAPSRCRAAAAPAELRAIEWSAVRCWRMPDHRVSRVLSPVIGRSVNFHVALTAALWCHRTCCSPVLDHRCSGTGGEP